MSFVSRYRIKFTAVTLLKPIVFSSVVISGMIFTGCASKPQVNNTRSYAVAPQFYTVVSGDTLSGIAARYGMNYIQIAELNDIAAPYRIFVGQSLRLKGQATNRAVTATTQASSSPQIQRQTIALPNQNSTAKTVVAAPVAKTASTSNTNQLNWVKPSHGAVIEHFDLAKNVKGTRYGGMTGDPVYAAAAGQVVYAADGLKEYGNLVLVKHINGYITAYAHNSKMNVKSGDHVTAGQKIAEMGSSGASRTMLEFQVRLDGKPINPITVFPNN